MMCVSVWIVTVSISTDGRVLEWNLKKGLVMSKLMDLKKSGTVRCLVAFCVPVRSLLSGAVVV